MSVLDDTTTRESVLDETEEDKEKDKEEADEKDTVWTRSNETATVQCLRHKNHDQACPYGCVQKVCVSDFDVCNDDVTREWTSK